MTDDQIRAYMLATVLKPHKPMRQWSDRWTHPDSLRGRMLDLDEKMADAKRKIAVAIAGPIEEVAAILREWWNAQPGMPYTAPSLWSADQMKAAP